MSTETMDVQDMAELLHKAPRTVAIQVTRSPHLLPPRVVIPGSNRVLWLRATVMAWLKRHEQVKRGRPRKQQLAPDALSKPSS